MGARTGEIHSGGEPFAGQLCFSSAQVAAWGLASGTSIIVQVELNGAMQPGRHARRLQNTKPGQQPTNAILVTDSLPGYSTPGTSLFVLHGWMKAGPDPASEGPTFTLKLSSQSSSPEGEAKPASQFPKDKLRVCIPAALSNAWHLAPGTSITFQLQMDGDLQQQAPCIWTATLSQTTSGLLRTLLPVELSRLITGAYFCGWRRLQDQTLVLVMSSSACSLLTVSQCLVRWWGLTGGYINIRLCSFNQAVRKVLACLTKHSCLTQ